jgi:uncharacterized membrane protein
MEKVCSITGRVFEDTQGVMWMELRPSLKNFVKELKTELAEDSFISYNALNEITRDYVAKITREEIEAYHVVVEKIKAQYEYDETLKPIEIKQNNEELSFADKMSDKIAEFGGSWRFIMLFLLFMLLWMILNSVYLAKGFDPYPYILLNLMLSCVAALQAPIIMMSQNRQEDKDRERSEYDYKVNLKAETEIRLLHKKLDHLLLHQQKNTVEMLQLQLDLTKQVQQSIEALKHTK